MLTPDQVQAYRRDGYLVVENVLTPRQLDTLHKVIDTLVQASREVTDHNQTYDLEPTHSADEPRVRRIKEPHNVHPAFREIAFSPKIAEILTPLIGTTSGIRYQTGKLNMKSAGYGAAVEWHQDWAFYPHTNDDLLAIAGRLGNDTTTLVVVWENLWAAAFAEAVRDRGGSVIAHDRIAAADVAAAVAALDDAAADEGSPA